MKSTLLKNVRIHSGKDGLVDMLISDGMIESIGPALNAESDSLKDLKGAWATPGWMDIGVQAADPGFEHREDLQSALSAAAAGGFTEIAVFPNTNPPIHSKAEVLYIKNKTSADLVACYPIGGVSENLAGKDLAELYDMHKAGAVAFSEGSGSIQDSGLLMRALQYTQAFGGLVIDRPYTESLAHGGQMHEGILSTQLGMRGIPALSETVALQRNLKILEYTRGKLHVHLVSTAESVEYIRKAKTAGLPVTASVAAANLVFTDAELSGFDSNFKVMPPLRLEEDRLALVDGVADGTIDFIASNHSPWDVEAKNLEFPYAQFGMLGLQTAFSLSLEALIDKLPVETIAEKWWNGPRAVLGFPIPGFNPGEEANLSFFDPEAEWTLGQGDILSKSNNTPLVDRSMKGKVLGVIRGAQEKWF